MKGKVKPIDFESETFGYMLRDMSESMNTLLRKMESMGSDDGKFTLTINIHLEDKELDDGDEHTVPEFKHKIKSGFNVTDETDGQLDGDYVLGKDEDGNYQLELLTEQLDMLEEAEEIE